MSVMISGTMRTTLPASELPANLKDAFIDALEAWSSVEWQLFIIYQFLGQPSHLDDAWTRYTALKSLTAQRNAVEGLAEVIVVDATDRAALTVLLTRVKTLSTKRNAIVHGRWVRRNVIVVDDEPGTETCEYLRRYDPADASRGRPRKHRDEDAVRGKTQFDADDLQRAEKEFRALNYDLFRFMERLMPHVARRPAG
jgi:hypothetical protein